VGGIFYLCCLKDRRNQSELKKKFGYLLLITEECRFSKMDCIGILTLARFLADIARSKAVVFFAYRFRLGYIVLGMDVASY
jgi:hypothetical protein